MKPFIVFFTVSALLLSILLLYIGNEYLNLISLLSQWLGLSIVGIFIENLSIDSKAIASQGNHKLSVADIIVSPLDSLENLRFVTASKIITIILFGTLIFGILNAYILIERLDIDKNTDNFIKSISFASLGVSQFGGWFFQAGLIYMLSMVLGGKLEFNIYLKLVGVAYVGFFILSIFTLVLNYFFIPDEITIQAFNELIQNSVLHTISGKIGEFWVLTIIGAGISKFENFSPTKGILICIIPSSLLLIFKTFFDHII